VIRIGLRVTTRTDPAAARSRSNLPRQPPTTPIAHSAHLAHSPIPAPLHPL